MKKKNKHTQKQNTKQKQADPCDWMVPHSTETTIANTQMGGGTIECKRNRSERKIERRQTKRERENEWASEIY